MQPMLSFVICTLAMLSTSFSYGCMTANTNYRKRLGGDKNIFENLLYSKHCIKGTH